MAQSRASSKPSPQALPSYLPLRTVRLREAVSVVQAMQQAPSLAGLAQLAQQSAQCLQTVSSLIPSSLRPAIQAGPMQNGHWCLLAANSACAAKLRQLAPALAAHLRTHGHDVQEIRIKIATRTLK